MRNFWRMIRCCIVYCCIYIYTDWRTLSTCHMRIQMALRSQIWQEDLERLNRLFTGLHGMLNLFRSPRTLRIIPFPARINLQIYKLEFRLTYGFDVLCLSTRSSISPLSTQHSRRRLLNLRRLLPSSNPPPSPKPTFIPNSNHLPSILPLPERQPSLLLLTSYDRSRFHRSTWFGH